nr:unnamed protein product [Brassica oleracea]
MDWLCEDMWWKMMVSNDYQSQYERFLWKWIEIATKHVISCIGVYGMGNDVTDGSCLLIY